MCNITYFPVVRNITILGDLINRACWYFPKSTQSKVEIYIPVDKDLIGIDLETLEAPRAQQRYIDNLDHIHLIKENEIDLSEASAIMLWDKKRQLDPVILRHIHKVKIVDPTYYFSVEAETYQRMFYTTLTPDSKEYFLQLSKKKLSIIDRQGKEF